MVEVLSESTAFSSSDGEKKISANVLLVNFRRLKGHDDEEVVREKRECSTVRSPVRSISPPIDSRDLFHSMAALYSTALPDMELEAIYGSLTKPSRTIFVLATEKAVLEYRKQHGPPTTLTNHKEPVETKDNEIEVESKKVELPEDNEEDYCDPYADLYSDSEDDDKCEEEEENEEVKTYDKERDRFLTRVKERRNMDPLDLASIGIEDRLVGSITFMRLSSKPGESSVQVLLLAVRHRWRGLGVGGYLLRLSKDPAIVGQYDVVLTFADHKAEKFFSCHGFTDDPIITARYKMHADYWENSTLMVYVPPYSTQTAGSLKSLEAMTDHIKNWRAMSIVAHCEQVCVMERLRQEVLLLQGRLASQQEVIDVLHRELRQSQIEKEALEEEFTAYRSKMQTKLLTLMEERARGWLHQIENQLEDLHVHVNDISGTEAVLTSKESLTHSSMRDSEEEVTYDS